MFSAEHPHFLPFTIRGFSMYFCAIQRAWFRQRAQQGFARMVVQAVQALCFFSDFCAVAVRHVCELVTLASFSLALGNSWISNMLLHFDLCHPMTLTMPTVYVTSYDKLTSCCAVCSIFYTAVRITVTHIEY